MNPVSILGRRITWHWNNENRRRAARGEGDGPEGLPTHGRFWVYMYDDADNLERLELELTFEWCLRKDNNVIAAGVEVGGGDDDLKMRWALWPLSLYFGLEGPFARALLDALGVNRKKNREWEFFIGSTDDWHAHWNLGFNPHEWRSSDGWKHRGVFLKDVILGKAAHSERILEERDVLIPMPEGSYDAHVKLTEGTWKRSRWPIPLRVIRTEIDVPKGIQKPGKGENSWDCGDDAAFGLTCPARSIEEGVGKLVGSVLRDRVRYGGREWVAKPRAVAE